MLISEGEDSLAAAFHAPILDVQCGRKTVVTIKASNEKADRFITLDLLQRDTSQTLLSLEALESHKESKC